MSDKSYLIRRTDSNPVFSNDFSNPSWQNAGIIDINNFRPEGSSHRPEVKAKALYDKDFVHLFYQVKDRYVRCIRQNFQDPVCKDSTVEAFIKPAGAEGYFNFELNCGGTMLIYYVIDYTRTKTGFVKYEKVHFEDFAKIKIFHSMPTKVEPEIQDETLWTAGMSIPFSIFTKYSGVKAPLAGSEWTANFYKCADETSHPHWASWSPVPHFNFHWPDAFGKIVFE